MKKLKINTIKKGEIKDVRKQAWSLVAKKNMIPLAIGIIIGGAFSLLVNSLANDVINQALAKAFGYKGLSYLSHGTTKWASIKVYDVNNLAVFVKGLPLDGIMYGKFLSALVSFFITTMFLFLFAFTTYMIMRRFIVNKDKKQLAPTTEQLILDELKTMNKSLKSKK